MKKAIVAAVLTLVVVSWVTISAEARTASGVSFNFQSYVDFDRNLVLDPDGNGNGTPDEADDVVLPEQEEVVCPADREGDTDGDGVCDDVDVCVDVADPLQADADEDGFGDLCDASPSEAPTDDDGGGDDPGTDVPGPEAGGYGTLSAGNGCALNTAANGGSLPAMLWLAVAAALPLVRRLRRL